MASGYVTTTYKMKLNCKRLDWLLETRKLYNQIRTFYHGLLLERPGCYEMGSQAILRELERLTLSGRNGGRPIIPLPYERIPAYFRRSAANGAIGAFKTWRKNHEAWQRKSRGQNGKESCEKSSVHDCNEQVPRDGGTDDGGLVQVPASGNPRRAAVAGSSEPKPAKAFQASPVFYKGMYRDFSENSITLKLWTGSSWAWVRCRYRGRKLPEGGERLSPVVVIQKNKAFLHIPVKTVVDDVRPVKKRVEQGEPVCAVAFTNTDAFAVCSVLQVDGRMSASRFIRGGNEYMHHSKRLLERIRANRAVLGRRFDWSGCNRHYWERLNHLSDYWAHKVSRTIVDFCTENKVKTITLVAQDYGQMRMIAKKTGKYSPIFLSLRIKRYLTYKAWKAGIAVTSVGPAYTSGVCSSCGAWLVYGKSKGAPKNIKMPSRSEREYRCPNGHRGNRDLNTARNIGRNCLNKLGKRPV